jgi:hypothetical protein
MDMGALIILIIIVSLLIGFLWASNMIRKKNEARKNREIDLLTRRRLNEVKNYFAVIEKSKNIPTIDTNLMLKTDEKAYLQDEVSLHEIRSVRKSTRGGSAIRVAKGVYIGGSSGTSRGYDEIREIDHGQLVLTNKRVIFDGVANSRDIRLDKIISVTEYLDGIEVAIEGRGKSQIYKGINNPYIWKSLIHYIRQIPESGELPSVDVHIKGSLA